MRALLALSVVVALAAPSRAHACIRAGEADKLLGWSADGAYALLVATTDKGAIEHAEILPTTYQGFVYVIAGDGDKFVLARAKVGACASFGDDGGVIERGKGAITEASIKKLKTVAAMKFGRDEAAPDKPIQVPTAAFTGAKRYDVHDVELAVAGGKIVLPLPVWCVGSCLADENWTKWKATVTAVHQLANSTVLYELSLANVCNGGTLIRLVAPTPAAIKVPKHRCMGSGDS